MSRTRRGFGKEFKSKIAIEALKETEALESLVKTRAKRIGKVILSSSLARFQSVKWKQFKILSVVFSIEKTKVVF